MKNPRHIKLLTEQELKDIKEKYNIIVEKQRVIVTLTNRNQTTVHNTTKSFSLRINDRKFTISKNALDMWKKYFKNYNIFDVQNAINSVLINRKIVTDESVKKVLDT